MATPSRPTAQERTVVHPTVFGVVVTVLIAVAAILRPPVADPSVVGLVWAGLAGAVVFGVVWPFITVRSVRVTIRSAPTDLVVDQLASLELELGGRASGLSVGCTGQAMTVLDVVSPGRLRIPFAVSHRGAYRRIRLDLGSDAPFGIVSVTRTRLVELPRELLVGPTTERESVAPGQLVGDHAAPTPSGAGPRGEAVRSVRPYVTGDPSHLVHWPSSARTGTLVVRELEPPAAEALAIVVDLSPRAGSTDEGDESVAVERAASRAAGLAESAFGRGARVLLCTVEASGPVVAEVADPLAVRRRLALAAAGSPPRPPEDWPAVTVGATDAPALRPPIPAGPPEPRTAPTRRRARVSADRRTITSLRVWALTVLVGIQLWAALAALPNSGERNVTSQAAALCAALAMFGLRSVPIRWIVRGAIVLSGLLIARFGELGAFEGVTGSWKVLAWLAAAAAALALAPSSRSAASTGSGIVVNAADLPDADRDPDVSTTMSSRDRSGRVGTVPVALLVAAVALIGASSLLAGPRVATGFPVGSKAGDIVDFADNRSDNALTARDSLDMTSRPRLSDQVVMTVRSPITSFWRTEVFDTWDGSTWSRSTGRGGAIVEDGRVVPDDQDLAATEGTTTTQEFRLEAGFATAVPAAPSPVRIEASTELFQRVDGTLVSPFEPLGRGTTYTVQSRQVDLDPAELRATSPDQVPAVIRDRYASDPAATDRVAQLARQVTAPATNDYDRVRALEAWMNQNTEYSLDAPLSPRGVDVVDHFLFEERLGWCEQIASSLVVMARSVGVPARLATGFAPGEWDAVGGRFVVREREAHAWTEVWFPEAGWVPFDPTASVPLAGTADATAGATARDWREIGGVALLVVGVVALSAGWLRRTVRRVRGERSGRRSRRRLLRTRWDAAEEARIERLGAAAGHPRGPGTTLTSYAATVGEILGDDEIAAAGAEVDRIRYAPVGPR